MRKINLIALLMAVIFTMASTNPAVAQNAAKGKPYIAAFDDGRTLTSADIKFLNSISNGKGEKEAVVSNNTFKVGQKLTAQEAAILNKAKSNYRRAHPMEKATDAKPIDKSRGQESCYWYLYCDGYGNCYYIWYCD